MPMLWPRCAHEMRNHSKTTHRDRTRATCKGPDHLVYILTLFTPSFQLSKYSSAIVSQSFYSVAHRFLHIRKSWINAAELCDCQTRRAPRNYVHSHEITAVGEARDETITTEQSTAAAGPALGVLLPVLGFFPAPFPLPFYLPVWETLPLYLGSAGGRSVATISHVCIDKAGIKPQHKGIAAQLSPNHASQ